MKYTTALTFLFILLTGSCLVLVANKTEASVGEMMKLSASATKVKFNDPLTLTWDVQPALLSGGMNCYDWDGEPITEAKGTKTIPHIRHQNRFQIGCSMVTETATNAVATAHASNLIEIEIDSSQPVTLSETPSFNTSVGTDDVTLEIKMGDNTYKMGRQGVVGNAQYKYTYIDTPETSGTVSWKYDTTDFNDCWFGSTELGKYVRENVFEEVSVPGSIPLYSQQSLKIKRMKPEGQANFDLSKDKNIILTCFSSGLPYKQKTANMQILFFNIEGESNAPAETPSTDLSKAGDPLKLTMKAGDKTYKVSGRAFDYSYDNSNTSLVPGNIGIMNIFTKSKNASLEWQVDSSIFKYCQSDGQESNRWPLGDHSTSGSKEVLIGPGTNLFQLTCTSGDKESLYTGASKMARVYISASQTSGLVINNGDVSDGDDEGGNDNNDNNVADGDENAGSENDDVNDSENNADDGWKDYSSMQEMPKVTADSGTPVCTTVPDEKFHGCYYKGKIDDSVIVPDKSMILGGEMVAGNRIDHDWGTSAIVTGSDGTQYPDNISAVWQGRFYFPDGDFIFKATADDGVKVNVEDVGDMIYKWYPQPRNTHISDIYHLKAGWHNVTVRYFEEGHKAAIKFWWEHQKPPVEAEQLSEQLNIFQQLVQQLQQLVTKILSFFGVKEKLS